MKLLSGKIKLEIKVMDEIRFKKHQQKIIHLNK